MSQDVAIRVEGIGKRYSLYSRPQDRLKEFFTRHFGKVYGHEFVALSDISFTVYKGQSLGIIGRNGSGKSTLLQIIAGTLQPSVGTVEVNGRVAALLELGSGFKSEFTGRENVYMNAALLGLSKREIDQRFDDIAAFADIGEFMDQQVKTYSSGMLVRVAFAVQVAVEPEILIIDEALSVGDIFFQQKCMKRMRQLREKGTTLLFVSHDTSSIRDLCGHVVYLRKGEAAFIGESRIGIMQYYREVGQPEEAFPEISIPDLCTHSCLNDNALLERFKSKSYWMLDADTPFRKANDFSLLGVAILDAARQPTTSVRMTDSVFFQVLFRANKGGKSYASITLQNKFGHRVTTVGSFSQNEFAPYLNSDCLYIFEICMRMMFEQGQYTFAASITKAGGRPNRATKGDQTPWLGPLTITWDYEKDWAPFIGMFGPPVEMKYISIEEDCGQV